MRKHYIDSECERRNIPNNSAYFSAFTSATKSWKVTFDTDSFYIICDTGASVAFTFCMNDFISFKEIDEKVEGLGTLKIKGVGSIQYNILTDDGRLAPLVIRKAYYVPDLKMRLVSPQQICEESHLPVSCDLNAHWFRLRWESHTKTIPYNKATNLPIMETAPGFQRGKAMLAHLRDKQSRAYCFRISKKIPQYLHNPLLDGDDMPIDDDLDDATIPASPSSSIADKAKQSSSMNSPIKIHCDPNTCNDCNSTNKLSPSEMDYSKLHSMSPLQKEFLHYHHRLGHENFATLKEWASHHLIPHKFAKVDPPICLGCLLGKQQRRKRNQTNGVISNLVTKPGDLIHIDQAETSTPGRPMTFSGRNSKHKITCFTLFIDSISKKIFAEFQTSTDAKQTIEGKKRFEATAQRYDVKITEYRADNGVFKSRDFKVSITNNNQTISFCGVGAHHQNGVAERHIGIIVHRARTMLLHANEMWPKGIDAELWTFAINYAIDQWNSTPKKSLNFLTPDEVFSGITKRHSFDKPATSLNTSERRALDISPAFHTWGCPVYVLRSPLQDGRSLPAFAPRAREGIFVGWSKEHARNVAMVLNPKTDHISCQFHVIFDDKFDTVNSSTNADKAKLWIELSKSTFSHSDKSKIDFTQLDKALPSVYDYDYIPAVPVQTKEVVASSSKKRLKDTRLPLVDDFSHPVSSSLPREK